MKALCQKLLELSCGHQNHQCGSMTLEIGSRSPKFELDLAITEDNNPVQYESPVSKTSRVIMRTPKSPMWLYDLGNWVKVTQL